MAIHPAQVAGMFYPAEPGALRGLIEKMRTSARPDGGVTPKIVVAPHAGVVYSGAVAATAFGPWAKRADPPRRVVIVGPAHRYAFRGLAGHRALAEARLAAVDPRPFAGEHSLEMHLVLLQAMLPESFEALPILVGDAKPGQVAEALRLVWGGPETVIAISSDLSHFLDQPSAEAIDSETGRLIEAVNGAALEGRRACGFLPIAGALEIAAERDLRVSGLHLATSADAGAGSSSVVGYGAFALEYAASARLSDDDRVLLLSCCMASLAAAAKGGGEAPRVAVEARLSPALASARASFVTLTENGKLRGCIGSSSPARPLIDDAAANAANAGFSDPRFEPLAEAELQNLSIDVSILSCPHPLRCANEAELIGALEPDRDGLILSAGGRRALFLPSVWRQIPDGKEFVRHLLAKAGLDSRRWPDGLDARRFRVESFGAPFRAIDRGEIAPVRIAARTLRPADQTLERSARRLSFL